MFVQYAYSLFHKTSSFCPIRRRIFRKQNSADSA
jgi:hypothetical protein